MTDLVPADGTPARFPADERWERELVLVGAWLKEQGTNTRAGYADAVGWPYSLLTGQPRDIARLRNGVSWLAWCGCRGVHVLDADRQLVLDWVEAIEHTPHPVSEKLLSKRTRAQMVSAVSSFYTWTVEEGHRQDSPVQFSRKKKGLNTSKDKSPTRSLSRAEANAMLKAADADPVETVRLRTSAVISLIFNVGLRVSELCNATLADMYVQDGIRVLHVVLKGKGDHEFALPPDVCRRVDAYVASRADVARLPARRGQASAATAPLIATATGKPMDRTEVLRLVKRIAHLAGLDEPDKVHPHVGRHTWVTEARRQGFVTSAIKDSVGHAFESTTDRYGQHVLNLANSPAFKVAAAFEAGDETVTPPAVS